MGIAGVVGDGLESFTGFPVLYEYCKGLVAIRGWTRGVDGEVRVFIWPSECLDLGRARELACC